MYLLWLFALGLVFVYSVFCPVLSEGSQSCTGHVLMHVCVLLSIPSVCAVAGQTPVVSVEPRAATVRQGESVSFRCQVGSGAQPVVLIEWKRANNQPLQGQE